MTRDWKARLGKLAGDESGYILIMSMFVIVVLFLIGTTLTILGIQEFNLSARTKLMDQAYSIADAGVNRAAVAIQMTPSLSQQTTPGPYPTAQSGPFTETFGGGSFTWTIYQSELNPSNPTYKMVRSTGTITKKGRTAERTIETRIIVGAGGEEYDASFDYCFYVGNSDNPVNPEAWPFTNDGFFLGGMPAGNYTWDGFTPYNGHSPRGAAYVKGDMNLPIRVLGDLEINGNIVATGNINLQSSWRADFNDPGIRILNNGKVIAGLDGTGSATVQVTAAISGTGSMVIDGQVIASDDVTVSTSWNGSFASPVTINGIKAGRDVTATGTANFSEGITLGSITAGRCITINSSWGAGMTAGNLYAGQNTGTGNGVVLSTPFASSINVGSIRSRGRVNASATLAGISMGTVVCGNSTAAALGGTGLYFNMGWGAGCNSGNITSTGLVDINATVISTISTGAITAGTDSATGSGGTGVQWRGNVLSSVTTNGGAVTSTGAIYYNASWGSNMNCGNIWGGEYVLLNGGELLVFDDSITTGNITSVGYVDVYSGDDVVVGTVWSNSWVALESSDLVQSNGISSRSSGAGGQGGYAVWVKSYALGGLAGNHVNTWGSIFAHGPILWYATAEGFGSDSHLNGGAWGTTVHLERALGVDVLDTTDAKIEKIPGYGNDAIRCGNNGGFWSQCPGWIGDLFDDDIDINGDVRVWSTASFNEEDTDYWSRINDNSLGLPTINQPGAPAVPVKPDPVKVDRNGVNDPGDDPANPGGGDQINVDVLYEAGLTSTVDLLEPNWEYFETMATQDDAVAGPSTNWKICPNVACGLRNAPTAPVCSNCGTSLAAVPVRAGGAHIITDGGPGDDDGVVNNVIRFVWDSNDPYSSNETIYNGDADVRLEIQALKWDYMAAAFVATIVSKGDCYITAPASDWFMDTEQELNLVSGNDITSTTAGLTLWESQDNHYHFWADHDINMQNMRFSFGGGRTYYGSFTAGNRVLMKDNSFWPDCRFRWSRWALDPVAWAPPFEVLTWKEI